MPASVCKVREDEDTGERLYDIVADASPDLSLKWVPRNAIKLPPKTSQELAEEKERKNMSLQLDRAREAAERRATKHREHEQREIRTARRGEATVRRRMF